MKQYQIAGLFHWAPLKSRILKGILGKDPANVILPMKKLLAISPEAYSGQINIQYRFVYRVIDDIETVKVI